MTPKELLDRLIILFPEFAAQWDETGNDFRDDDGAFTLHGVFSEFSHFFQERYEKFPDDRVAALGLFVSNCMASDDVNLDNAAATCFLENIAGDSCDRILKSHLTGQARDYIQRWDGRLLPETRELADRCFATLQADSRHPSLQLKKVGPFWSARVGLRIRAWRKNAMRAWFGSDRRS